MLRRSRAPFVRQCQHIEEAQADLQSVTQLTEKLYGAESAQVALSLAEQAKFCEFVTEPSDEQWRTALALSRDSIAMLDRILPADSPRFASALRVRGKLLVRTGELEAGIAALERYKVPVWF